MDHLHASLMRPLSERLYRLLLRAYPRGFREEYGSEMLLVFRDAYRDASRERGTIGVLAFWGELAYDLLTSVCVEQARRWRTREDRGLALAGKEQLAMALPYTLRVAQHTDIGRVRARNEDGCGSQVPDDEHLLRSRGALFVVTDGMGGRGDVASELVVQQVTELYYQGRGNDLPVDLRSAVEQAGAALCRMNASERERGAGGPELGATCVAAVLHERWLYVANVGDSRAYVLHAGQLRQVTRDHSLVAQLVERGELTAAEARTHPERHLIYRALGLPNTEVDLYIEPIEEDDTLVLCTDGLSSVLDDDELADVVQRYSPNESVRELIARANARGGPDNITALVVRVFAVS
jgi:serine/threonine protein phosphatase PrpC